MYRMFCIVLIGLLALCGLSGCTEDEATGDAQFAFSWPVNGQSLWIDSWGRGEPLVVNRTGATEPATFIMPDTLVGTNRFTAKLYEGPNATGQVLAIGFGKVRVNENALSPVASLTTDETDARLAIEPTNLRLNFDDTQYFVANAIKDDGSFVLCPPTSWSWQSSNPSLAKINPSTGFLEPDDEHIGTVTVTANAGQSLSALTIVELTAPEPNVTLTADNTTIKKGASTTLRWSSTHATGVKSTSGFYTTDVDDWQTIAPTSTTYYSITVTGPGGTDTADLWVHVTKP